jgi:hypothetical protein
MPKRLFLVLTTGKVRFFPNVKIFFAFFLISFLTTTTSATVFGPRRNSAIAKAPTPNFYYHHPTFLERHIRYAASSPHFPIDIVVALPEEEGNVGRNPYLLTIAKARPVFDVAIDDIHDKRRLLHRGALRIAYVNTELSDSVGPQKVVER